MKTESVGFWFRERPVRELFFWETDPYCRSSSLGYCQPAYAKVFLTESIVKKGIALLVFGVIGLITAYSHRPPSGIGEALLTMAQERPFLDEPEFLLFMAISAILAIFGIIEIAKKDNK